MQYIFVLQCLFFIVNVYFVYAQDIRLCVKTEISDPITSAGEVCTCSMGQYKSSVGDCMYCPRGKYKDVLGPQECSSCDVFSDAIGETKCSVCNENSFIDIQSKCHECPRNIEILFNLLQTDIIRLKEEGDYTEFSPKLELIQTLLDGVQADMIENFKVIFTVTCPDTGVFLDDFLELQLLCTKGTERVITNTGESVCEHCAPGKYKDIDDMYNATVQRRCITKKECSGDYYTTEGGNVLIDSICVEDKYDVVDWCYPTTNELNLYYTTPRYEAFDVCTKCTKYTVNGDVNGIDRMENMWRDGKIQAQPTDTHIDCVIACNTGYTLSKNNTCVACESGKYKGIMGNTECSDCPDGSFVDTTGTGCTTCQLGEYMSAMECKKCCEIDVEYRDGDECYEFLSSHYITDRCQGNTKNLNVLPCPYSTNSVISMWEVYSEVHCMYGRDGCTSEKYYDMNTKGCVQCPQNEVNIWLSVGTCRPSCENGYYLQKQESDVSFDVYECTLCSQSVDYMQKTCQFTDDDFYYLDLSTCNAKQNTQCTNCLDIRRPYEIPSYINNNLFGPERCLFECIGHDISNRLYYVTFEEAVDILHTTRELLIDSFSEFIINGVFKGCIRSEVLFWHECPQSYPEMVKEELDLSSNGLQASDFENYETWPTIKCADFIANACTDKGGMYEVENELGSGDIEVVRCHCSTGYYGVYDTINGDLLSCIECPYGSTSLAGTNNIDGCYCSGGFANYSESNNYECGECSLVVGSNYYCTGGIDDTILASIRENIKELRSTATQISLLQTKCNVCKCAEYTSTKNRYAYSSKNCIILAGFFINDETGLAERCDHTVYNSSSITKFTDTSVYCSRECHYPSAIKDIHGQCTCNTALGYVIDVVEQKCVCDKGWYVLTADSVCIPCISGAYCKNGVTISFCGPGMTSNMYSTSFEDCICSPGYYKSDKYCIICTRGSKCNGVTIETCQGGSTTDGITDFTEICDNLGTYKPKTCMPGKAYEPDGSSNRDYKCIFMKSTRLFTNIIINSRDEVLTIYNVYAPTFTEIISNPNYDEGYDKVYAATIAGDIHCGENMFITLDTNVNVLNRTDDILSKRFKCVSVFSFSNTDPVFYKISKRSLTPIGKHAFIDTTFQFDNRVLLDAEEHLLWILVFSCRQPLTNSLLNVDYTSHTTLCLDCSRLDGKYIALSEKYEITHQHDEYLIILNTFTVPIPATAYLHWEHNTSTLYLHVTQYSAYVVNSTDILDFIELSIIGDQTQYAHHVFSITKYVFGIIDLVTHLPVWKMKSTSYPSVILGACPLDNMNTLTLHFYNLVSNDMYTSVFKCDDCCSITNNDKMKNLQLFIEFDNQNDNSGDTYFIFTAHNKIYYTKVDEETYHENHILYSDTVDKRSMSEFEMMGLDENETLLEIDTWQKSETTMYSYALSSSHGGTLGLIQCSFEPATCSFTRYTKKDDIVQFVMTNHNHGVHYTSSLLDTNHSSSNILHTDVITLDKGRNTGIPDKVEILVHLTMRNILNLLTNVILLVTIVINIDNSYTLEASILTTFFDDIDYKIDGMEYSLVPTGIETGFKNIVQVHGVVSLYFRYEDKYNIRVFEFGCAGCKQNEVYDVENDICQCMPGTFSLCTECFAGTCNKYSKNTDKVDSFCIEQKITAKTEENTNVLHSLSCVPCTGRFYCPTGNNYDIMLCPEPTPYTLIYNAKSREDCVSGENFTTVSHSVLVDIENGNDNEFLSFMASVVPTYNQQYSGTVVMVQNPEVSNLGIFNCPPNSICNALYNSRKQNFKCKSNTVYKNQIFYTIDKRKVVQKCECIPGYYATSTQEVNAFSNTFENFMVKTHHISDIRLQKLNLNISLDFFSNSTDQGLTQHHISEVERATQLYLESLCVTEPRLVLLVSTKLSCTYEDESNILDDYSLDIVYMCEDEFYTINFEFIISNPGYLYTIQQITYYNENENFISFFNAYDVSFFVHKSLTMTHSKSDDTSLVGWDLFFDLYEYSINVDTCMPCPPGFYCKNGQKYKCSGQSTSNAQSSTENDCLCLPGYAGLQCKNCPAGTLCYGGDKTRDCDTQNPIFMDCPCPRGMTRDYHSLECVHCPKNMYCPFVNDTTGIDPVFLHARLKCPDNSFSGKFLYTLYNTFMLYKHRALINYDHFHRCIQ